MKELTIVQKAQRYDEALKKAKALYGSSEPMSGCSVILEIIFPELKSEDETARKAIMALIEWSKSYSASGITNDDAKKMLSWLERQGEYANFRNKIQIGDRVTRNEGGVLVNLSQLKRVAKPSKKQGDKKASYTTIVETGDGGINALVTRELPTEMKSAEESLGIDSDTYNKIVDECIFDEQKPADKIEPKDYSSIDPHFGKPIDKVEPKFHEGEWIVHHGTENIYQVVAVIDNQYQLKYGNTYTVQKCADVDRCARLWDIIKDAKKGDVLYSLDNNQPFIYKERKQNEQATAYCGLNIYEKFFVWGTKDCVTTLSNYVPATKEQRDTLLKAMADAGYTFDFEKKELLVKA